MDADATDYGRAGWLERHTAGEIEMQPRRVDRERLAGHVGRHHSLLPRVVPMGSRSGKGLTSGRHTDRGLLPRACSLSRRY